MSDLIGNGIFKGLGITLKRFINTYIDDLKWFGKRYHTDEGIAHRSSKNGKGIFTVQYPEEKIPVPEEFRFVPLLVFDFDQNGDKVFRCTSCGICSRVCPPQCIWIVRTVEPTTNRPIPDPAEFYIDADICMNCGLCAEYCPFDAIKMDHDYALASFNRNLFDKNTLAKPASYYNSIRPNNASRENAARAVKEAARLGHGTG